MDITTIIDKQRQYYESESTMSYRFRLEALKKLKQGLIKHQKAFEEALYKDLNKSPIESYFAEIGLTLKEITHQEKHLKRYMKNRPVKTSLTDFHAKSYISPHPYGVTLIMSPWNYPLMLTLCPLAGAIAAGNTCIVKPSDYSHHTSLALKAMIEDTFPEEYVALVTGGRSENQTLLDQKFDYIFFTGSKQVGQIVTERASRHLTPISLELGGKSPCIVDRSSSLKIAARRIAFGKYLNAGQTCVAPDYVLIDETVKDEFIGYFKSAIADTFGNDPLESELLVKIINTKHFDRLKNLLDNQKIAIGGKYNADTLKIEPTVIDDVFEDNFIMDHEIFGPIFPIMTFKKSKKPTLTSIVIRNLLPFTSSQTTKPIKKRH